MDGTARTAYIIRIPVGTISAAGRPYGPSDGFRPPQDDIGSEAVSIPVFDPVESGGVDTIHSSGLSIWIGRFDQPDLLLPPPGFHFPLPPDRRHHSFLALKVNEAGHVVLGGESAEGVRLVLENTMLNVTGYSNVQSSPLAAQNVDVVDLEHLYQHAWLNIHGREQTSHLDVGCSKSGNSVPVILNGGKAGVRDLT